MKLRMILAVPVLFICGCASDWQPIPVGDVDFLSRATTIESNNIAVTTAVPSASETVAIFGADLYKRGVQPIWLEIRNDSDEAVSFMPFGVDPNFYTPLETASMHRLRKQKNEFETYFFASGVDPEIQAGTKRSGFVFTHVDEGTKAFNVDLVGETTSWHETFFIAVPGLKIDHYEVDFDGIYDESEIQELEKDELHAVLSEFQCCVFDSKEKNTGDPLNIAVIGDPRDVYYAFVRAGWDETESIKLVSSVKTAISFVSGGEYRYSPVSSLYVFGRPQDVAFQKARSNIHERNHLRLWMAPMTFDGKPVWIGQISRDIGVRFTKKTITTHKIDPDVDETREYLIENLAYSQVLEKLAYVDGVGPAPIDAPRGNLTGDPFFTDGQRALLWLSVRPIPLDEIVQVEW